jgi:acyl carrier protein
MVACHATERQRRRKPGQEPVRGDDEMRNRIAQIIINELRLKDVTPETFDPNLDLIEDLGIDSMELTTIVVVLQDEFGVKVDEDDFGQLTTLSRITEYIERKKKG